MLGGAGAAWAGGAWVGLGLVGVTLVGLAGFLGVLALSQLGERLRAPAEGRTELTGGDEGGSVPAQMIQPPTALATEPLGTQPGTYPLPQSPSLGYITNAVKAMISVLPTMATLTAVVNSAKNLLANVAATAILRISNSVFATMRRLASVQALVVAMITSSISVLLTTVNGLRAPAGQAEDQTPRTGWATAGAWLLGLGGLGLMRGPALRRGARGGRTSGQEAEGR